MESSGSQWTWIAVLQLYCNTHSYSLGLVPVYVCSFLQQCSMVVVFLVGWSCRVRNEAQSSTKLCESLSWKGMSNGEEVWLTAKGVGKGINRQAELNWGVLLGDGKGMGKGRERAEERDRDREKEKKKQDKSCLPLHRNSRKERLWVGGDYLREIAWACIQSHTQSRKAYTKNDLRHLVSESWDS